MDETEKFPSGQNIYRYSEGQENKFEPASGDSENNYWPIRWLKTVARFPHLYNTWIGYGHTIPNGEEAAPFSSNTKLGCILVLPSITLPEEFWSLKTDTKEINFFCLYPLYPEELDYQLKHGVDKLLDKFEAVNIVDVIDPQRKNVCTGKRFLGLW